MQESKLHLTILMILVIGSEKHKGATCVSWEDKIPYVGDYQYVVINMQSLETETLQKVKPKILEIRKELEDAIWANTSVYCITAPTIFIEEGFDSFNNYSWCPFNIMFTPKEGTQFEDKPKIKGYLSLIDKWSHYLEGININRDYTKNHDLEFVSTKVDPILLNKSKRVLGFYAYIKEYDTYSHDYIRDLKQSNKFVFLPPATKITVKQGIDSLIQDLIESNTSKVELPIWTQDIHVTNEKDLIDKIAQNEKLIAENEKDNKELKNQYEELIEYKYLLSENGDNLDSIVKKALRFIGIEVKPKKYDDEDGIIVDPLTKEEIPIEIGGSSKGFNAEKIRQIIDWSKDSHPTKILCRGLLIINPYKDKPLDNKLSGRGTLMEDKLVEKAKVWDIGILPTIELFRAVKAKFQDKNVDSFIKTIFNENSLQKFPTNSKHSSQYPLPSVDSNTKDK